MRKYLLAAAAAAAITSPAMARDRAGYVGVDLGALLVEDVKIDVTNAAGTQFQDYAIGDHKYGYDVGVNAGYDFGAIRAEAEVAYKRARHDELQHQRHARRRQWPFVVAVAHGQPAPGLRR